MDKTVKELNLAKDDLVMFIANKKLYFGAVFGFHYQKVEVKAVSGEKFLLEPTMLSKLL